VAAAPAPAGHPRTSLAEVRSLRSPAHSQGSWREKLSQFKWPDYNHYYWQVPDVTAFLLPLFASALGGAFVAGGFGLYNHRITQRDERKKWVRDQKLEAFSHYLDVTSHMGHAVSAYRVAMLTQQELIAAFAESAPGKMEILASPALRAATEDFNARLYILMNESRNPQIFSLENEAAFDKEIEKLNESRGKVIRQIQQDLGLDEVEYPVSGSELTAQ
jgi:hypothetical protein